MNMKTLILVTLIISILFPFTAFTQEAPTNPELKELHQIFLDEPIKKINKLEHMNDDATPIEHRISPDGKSIHMINYNGEGGVKAEVVTLEGKVEEIIRSKCYIHSLQEL